MRRLVVKLGAVLAVALGAAGCGSPAPRGRCAVDAECGAGSYCAAGGVCWADATPPVLDTVTVSCPAPCLRDSTLAVAAWAHDDARLVAVTARLDLAPGVTVPLVLQGGAWRADLPLMNWPFAAFERTVEVTVEARDGAGNTSSASRSAGLVTRLRWAVEVAPGASPVPVPGAVAVDAQGTAIFGASDARLYFVKPDGSAQRAPVAVGAGALTAPVVVGSAGVWVPSDDGKVYRVPGDPLLPVEMVCDTGAAVKGVALLGGGTPFAASSMGVFMSVVSGSCRSTTVYPGTIFVPGVCSGDKYLGAEGSNIHSISLNPGGFVVENWPAPTHASSPVSVPMAIRSTGEVLVPLDLGTAGALLSISPDGTPTTLAPPDVPSDGPVVLANNDVVIPEKGKTLSAWTSAGALRWRSVALPGTPLTPLSMTGADALVVADTRGNLSALDAAGSLRWTTQLSPAAIPLRAPNLFTPAGADRSTGYLTAANGKLYAVILDGHLDGSAPWPKSAHDPRNTGNSATPLPTP